MDEHPDFLIARNILIIPDWGWTSEPPTVLGGVLVAAAVTGTDMLFDRGFTIRFPHAVSLDADFERAYNPHAAPVVRVRVYAWGAGHQFLRAPYVDAHALDASQLRVITTAIVRATGTPLFSPAILERELDEARRLLAADHFQRDARR